MTRSRLAIMVVFALTCFGLLLFLWVSFGGSTPLKPKGYRADVLFPEATQLAEQADVRVSGVPIGKVVDQRRDGDRTRATLQIDPRYAPLRADARAILRQKTLLGEIYVEMTPGSPGAPEIPEGGTLARGQVASTVELDEVLQAFDAPSRRNLQRWMQGWSAALKGRGTDINDAVGNLGPLLQDGGDVFATFDAQSRAVQGLVRDAGTVFRTVGRRDVATRELVTAGDQVLRTTAARRDDLRATVRALPPFLQALDRSATSTRALSRDLLPAVRDLRPVARDLKPTLDGGAALGDDLRDLSRDLSPVLSAARNGLPATTAILQAAGPLFDRLAPFSRDLEPATAFLAAYRTDFTQSWAKVAAATNRTAPTASGRQTNYLRLLLPVWNETLGFFEQRAPSNRSNPYPAPLAQRKIGPDGGYESFDCTNTGNPQVVPPLGQPPACLQQQPFDAGAGVSRFPKLSRAPE
ncbi:MlaD family protein [Paraconexibacter algicola]|nr:MlaD family protein [Paraconexibacter algicola]